MLRKGFESKLRLRTQSFLFDNNGENRDTTHNFLEAGLNWKLKLSGRGNIFHAEGWVEGGNAPDTYGQVVNTPRDLKRTRNTIEIAEIYYTREFQSVDVTIGKRTVPMGLGNLYLPSDRLTPKDLNDPTAAKSLGLWQAGIDSWFDDVLISLKALPVFQPSKFPSQQTRWAGPADGSSSGNLDFNFTPTEGTTITEDYPRSLTFRNTQWLLKTKTTIRGWDVFAAGFYGPSPHSVLTQAPIDPLALLANPDLANRFSKANKPVVHTSAGFATTYKKLEFHGESLSQTSPKGWDDDFINSVLGWTYTFDELGEDFFLEKITLNADYAWENLLRRQNNPNATQSSKKSRAGRETYMSQVEFQFNDDLKAAAGFTFDNFDGGHSELFGAEYRIRSGLVFKAALELFSGASNSNLGRWNRADRIVTVLEYSL